MLSFRYLELLLRERLFFLIYLVPISQNPCRATGGGGAGGSCEFHTEQIRAEGASSATFKRELSGQMESLGPGSGSDGGQGGDGCVILYYREAQVRDTGRFIEKNGRDFIELFFRRLIV